jgi:hypothetical protein
MITFTYHSTRTSFLFIIYKHLSWGEINLKISFEENVCVLYAMYVSFLVNAMHLSSSPLPVRRVWGFLTLNSAWLRVCIRHARNHINFWKLDSDLQ